MKILDTLEQRIPDQDSADSLVFPSTVRALIRVAREADRYEQRLVPGPDFQLPGLSEALAALRKLGGEE